VKTGRVFQHATERFQRLLKAMSKSHTRADKPTDGNRDVTLIDEATVRRLDDERIDEPGCRFAAVARSLESKRAPNTRFEFPVTRVAYVDERGRYGIEREFFGHRRDWQAVPRTVVVTDPDAVREIPEAHRERYRRILETYERVLDDGS
jgi:hypothetical protein